MGSEIKRFRNPFFHIYNKTHKKFKPQNKGVSTIMTSKKIITLSLAFILLFSIPMGVLAQDNSTNNTNNATQESQQKKVAAVINGNEVTMTQLNQFAGTNQLVMSIYRQNKAFAQVILQSEPGQKLLEKYREKKLQDLIRQRLIIQEAKDRDLTLSQSKKDQLFQQHIQSVKQQNQLNDDQLEQALQKQGIESLDQYKEVFLQRNQDQLLINELRKQVTKDVSVSEDKIEEYYNNNKKQFQVDQQVKASQILIKTNNKEESKAKEEIQSIKEQINSGKSFTEMAKQHSEGPYADKGGQLGFITKGQISEEFDKVAFNLNKGEISDPVKTKYGYHLIKVSDKKEAGVKSLEEVKDSIRQQLANEKKNKQWDEFVSKLRKNADITVKL